MRRFLQLFWAALAAVIFVPILGGFFSELAKEQGWYEHPTARVETVMSWLSGIAFHPAYLFAAGLVLGLALGMWMDLVIRKPKTQEERILTNGPVVLSNFHAQINDGKKLVIAFHYENIGPSVARSIKIETKAGVGPVPIQGEPRPPPFMTTTSYNYVDDLAPRGSGDITLVVDHVLSDAEWAAINGKPFGCAAWGTFNYRLDGDRVSEPFDYWVLRPPGQDLSKMTNMVPRPDFIPRPD